MPSMPRINKKTTDICFNIIGVPANMATKQTRKKKKIDQSLALQDTKLSR